MIRDYPDLQQRRLRKIIADYLYDTPRLLHEANSYHLLIAQQVLSDHFELQGAIRIDPIMNIRGCHAGETYNGQPRYSYWT